MFRLSLNMTEHRAPALCAAWHRQFENELKPLKPVCDQIIDSILDKYGKYSKTVIIHDLSIWDSSKYMEGVAQTMKSWKQELPSK